MLSSNEVKSQNFVNGLPLWYQLIIHPLLRFRASWWLDILQYATYFSPRFTSVDRDPMVTVYEGRDSPKTKKNHFAD